MKKIILITLSICFLITSYYIPVSLTKSDTDILLTHLFDLQYTSFVYSIDNRIVFRQDHNVVMYSLVQRKFIESFGQSELAQSLVELEESGAQSNEYVPINNKILLNTNKGISCFDAITGKRIWLNVELVNNFYYAYERQAICIDGITYTTKNYFHRLQTPEIICIDEESGVIKKEIKITGEKLKERDLLYAKIYAIAGDRIIISDGGYYLYCFNAKKNEIEWISDAILPLKFSFSKCLVYKNIFILREEIQDPYIVVPPCGEYDLYPPTIGIYSMETCKEKFVTKAHDFYIKDNYLYYIKFPECYIEKSVIGKINLDTMTLEKTIDIPFKVRFSYCNFESIERVGDKLYIATETPNKSTHQISIFDLNKFEFVENMQMVGDLVQVLGWEGRRIHKTDNYILVSANNLLEVLSTKKEIGTSYKKYIDYILSILLRIFIR